MPFSRDSRWIAALLRRLPLDGSLPGRSGGEGERPPHVDRAHYAHRPASSRRPCRHASSVHASVIAHVCARFSNRGMYRSFRALRAVPAGPTKVTFGCPLPIVRKVFECLAFPADRQVAWEMSSTPMTGRQPAEVAPREFGGRAPEGCTGATTSPPTRPPGPESAALAQSARKRRQVMPDKSGAARGTSVRVGPRSGDRERIRPE